MTEISCGFGLEQGFHRHHTNPRKNTSSIDTAIVNKRDLVENLTHVINFSSFGVLSSPMSAREEAKLIQHRLSVSSVDASTDRREPRILIGWQSCAQMRDIFQYTVSRALSPWERYGRTTVIRMVQTHSIAQISLTSHGRCHKIKCSRCFVSCPPQLEAQSSLSRWNLIALIGDRTLLLLHHRFPVGPRALLH